MNKKALLLICIATLLLSCDQNKNETFLSVTESNKNLALRTEQEPIEGYTLMKNNCYVCHNPNAESHDDLLAPPFKVVKMRYNREYDAKEDFVNAIVNWVQNPEEEKALMFGAIKQFNVMPRQMLSAEDVRKIAIFIYDNDVEEPIWMKEHMKRKNKGRKGNGKRQMENGRRGNLHNFKN